MKIINLSLLASILLISCSSCHRKMAKDEGTKNAVTVTGQSSDTMSPGAPTNQGEGSLQNDQGMGDKYDLVLSFYSIGAGIDSETKESFDKFLEGYKGKVNAEQTRWGREGEVDYCLKLSSLPEAERKEFISKSRTLLEKSKLVHIKENSPCVHKK